MYYINVYCKPNNEIVIKQVKNRHAYKNWLCIGTYVLYDNKIYSWPEWEVFRKSKYFNFWERLVLFFRDL